MALSYSFKIAVQSIVHEKWINLLSILTIAAGLLFTTLTILAIYNIDIATKSLPEKFSVMIYLSDHVSQREKDAIINTARNNNAVEKVKFIPKDEALKELKSTLKDMGNILEGLSENPLPDSMEIKFKSEAIGPEIVKNLTTRLGQLKGVQEIEYGEKFLSSLYSVRKGVKTVGLLVILLMSAGMLFVCYSTVKILFYRKEKDIETYKLLGATRGFIRSPFLIEGAVIGFFGGVLGLIGIIAIYYLVVLKLGLTFPLFKSVIFPVDMSFSLPFAGLVLGITGAAIAIGRIRY
jgi:cell division transport system permease protein